MQTVSICGYLEPLSAVLFSAIFLHETLLPLQIVGAVLILSGAVFGEWGRSFQNLPKRKQQTQIMIKIPAARLDAAGVLE